MLRRSFLPLLWTALAAFPAPSPTAAEADLKAAMLFNFTKFIEWQGARGETKTPVTVAVAGDDGVRDALLELVRGRPAGGRPVQVVRAEQPSDAETSHLIFVGRGVKKRQPEFLALSRRGW